MTTLGVIGGTGFAALEGFAPAPRDGVDAPWGKASAPLLHGRLAGHAVVFIARHGSAHDIAPHEVNYRANLWALREAGVTRVVAINAVGGIGEAFPPGTLAIPHQLIDYSWGRAHTFFEGSAGLLKHVDFTEPYSEAMRTLLLAAAADAGLVATDGAVYGVTQGPRLETAAEIERLARDGCDIVGMTGMPEAGLARELGLDYACCAVVVNRAAGRGADIHGEFARWVDEGMTTAFRLVQALCSGLEQG